MQLTPPHAPWPGPPAPTVGGLPGPHSPGRGWCLVWAEGLCPARLSGGRGAAELIAKARMVAVAVAASRPVPAPRPRGQVAGAAAWPRGGKGQDSPERLQGPAPLLGHPPQPNWPSTTPAPSGPPGWGLLDLGGPFPARRPLLPPLRAGCANPQPVPGLRTARSWGSGPLCGSWGHPGLRQHPRCPALPPRPAAPGGGPVLASPAVPAGEAPWRVPAGLGPGGSGAERGSRLAAPPSAAFSSSENRDASVVWLHLGAAPRGPGSVYMRPPTGPQPMPSPPERRTPRRRGRHGTGAAGGCCSGALGTRGSREGAAPGGHGSPCLGGTRRGAGGAVTSAADPVRGLSPHRPAPPPA